MNKVEESLAGGLDRRTMSNRPPKTRRHAVALIEMMVVIGILGVLTALSLAAVQRVRAAAARGRCQDNLRQLALALSSFHSLHGRLPSGVTVEDRRASELYMNWHTRLLPFLEQTGSWQQSLSAFAQVADFRRNPPHFNFSRPMPIFECPLDPRSGSAHDLGNGFAPALTSYLGVEGLRAFFCDGVLYVDSRTRLVDVSDGTSQTLLVGERPASADMNFGWWYGGWGQDADGEADSVLGVRTKYSGAFGSVCPVGPYDFGPGRLDNQCDAYHYWSLHPGGANFAFCDGSVRFLAYSADPIMPALATRAGGEAVAVPD